MGDRHTGAPAFQEDPLPLYTLATGVGVPGAQRTPACVLSLTETPWRQPLPSCLPVPVPGPHWRITASVERHSRPGEAKGQHGGWGSMAGVWARGTEQTQWAYGMGQAGLHPKSSRHPCGPVALTMESAHGPEPLQSGHQVCPNQDHVGSQEEVPQGSYNTSTAPHTVSRCSPTPAACPPGSVLLHLTCLYPPHPPLRDPSFFLLG